MNLVSREQAFTQQLPSPETLIDTKQRAQVYTDQSQYTLVPASVAFSGGPEKLTFGNEAPPAPVEPPKESPGTFVELGKGLARGVVSIPQDIAGLVGMAGSGMKWSGETSQEIAPEAIQAPFKAQAAVGGAVEQGAKAVGDYLNNFAQTWFPEDPDVQKGTMGEKLWTPAWWGSKVGEIFPNLATLLIPAGWVGKAAKVTSLAKAGFTAEKAATIAADLKAGIIPFKSLEEAIAFKMGYEGAVTASASASAKAGAAIGGLQSAGVEEMKALEQGKSGMGALAPAAGAGVVGAGLQYINVSNIFRQLPQGVLKNIGQAALTGSFANIAGAIQTAANEGLLGANKEQVLNAVMEFEKNGGVPMALLGVVAGAIGHETSTPELNVKKLEANEILKASATPVVDKTAVRREELAAKLTGAGYDASTISTRATELGAQAKDKKTMESIVREHAPDADKKTVNKLVTEATQAMKAKEDLANKIQGEATFLNAWRAAHPEAPSEPTMTPEAQTLYAHAEGQAPIGEAFAAQQLAEQFQQKARSDYAKLFPDLDPAVRDKEAQKHANKLFSIVKSAVPKGVRPEDAIDAILSESLLPEDLATQLEGVDPKIETHRLNAMENIALKGLAETMVRAGGAEQYTNESLKGTVSGVVGELRKALRKQEEEGANLASELGKTERRGKIPPEGEKVAPRAGEPLPPGYVEAFPERDRYTAEAINNSFTDVTTGKNYVHEDHIVERDGAPYIPESAIRDMETPEFGKQPMTEADVNAFAQEQGVDINAESIRSNAGQVYQGGNDLRGGEGQSRENLQRSAQTGTEAGNAGKQVGRTGARLVEEAMTKAREGGVMVVGPNGEAIPVEAKPLTERRGREWRETIRKANEGDIKTLTKAFDRALKDVQQGKGEGLTRLHGLIIEAKEAGTKAVKNVGKAYEKKLKELGVKEEVNRTEKLGQQVEQPPQKQPWEMTREEWEIADQKELVASSVADVQRGTPESVMRKITSFHAGVLNIVENVGDLTHRMTERVAPAVYISKIKSALNALEHPYGFVREHKENLKSNAQYRKISESEYSTKVATLLNDYANAHRQIPVFNEYQQLARDAAVALGEQRWETATSNLRKLLELTEANPNYNTESLKFNFDFMINDRKEHGLPFAPVKSRQIHPPTVTQRAERAVSDTDLDNNRVARFRESLTEQGIPPALHQRAISDVDLGNILDNNGRSSDITLGLFRAAKLGDGTYSMVEGKPLLTLDFGIDPNHPEYQTELAAHLGVYADTQAKVQQAIDVALGPREVAVRRSEAEAVTADPHKVRQAYIDEDARSDSWTQEFKNKVMAAYQAHNLPANTETFTRALDDATFLLHTRAMAWASQGENRTPFEYYATRVKDIAPTKETTYRGETVGAFTHFDVDSHMNAVINITKAANETTVLHELQHIWFTDVNDPKVREWLNSPKVKEWAQRKGYSGFENPVYKGKDGAWHITEAAEESWVAGIEKLHASDKLGPEVPTSLLGTFRSIRTWLANVLRPMRLRDWGADRPTANKAVREAYTRLFVPPIKGTATAKTIDTIVKAKSGTLRVNPAALTMTDSQTMKLAHDAVFGMDPKETWDTKSAMSWAAAAMNDPKEAERLWNDPSPKAMQARVAFATMNLGQEFQTVIGQLPEGATPKQMKEAVAQLCESLWFERASELSHGVGAALQMYKNTIQVVMRTHSLIDQLGAQMNKHDLYRLNQAMKEAMDGSESGFEKLQDSMSAAQRSNIGHLNDLVSALIYNNLLSNPGTSAFIMMNNMLWSHWLGVPHKLVTSGLDAIQCVFTGKERTVFASEVLPFLESAWGNIGPDLHLAWKRFIGEEPIPLARSRQDIGTVGEWADSRWALPRFLSKYMFYGSRAVGAIDAMNRAQAGAGYIAAMKQRRAEIIRRGGTPGRELSDEMIMTKAFRFGKETTFQQPAGPLVQALSNAKNKFGVFGVMAIPFMNTAANVIKASLEMMPGFGEAVYLFDKADREKAASRATNPAAREKALLGRGLPDTHLEAIAKQVEGVAIMAVMYAMFNQGTITGAMPDSPAERDSWRRRGIQPWSFKVGNNWVSYQRIDPFGLAMGATGIWYDRVRRLQAQAANPAMEPQIGKEIWDGANMWKALVFDVPWMRTFGDLGREKGMKQTTKGMVDTFSSLIPYVGLYRAVARDYLAYNQLPRPDTDSIVGQFVDSVPIPYNKLNVPTAFDTWGEKVVVNPGMLWNLWLPLRVTVQKQDAVEDEFQRLADRGFQHYPGKPQRVIMVNKKREELTPEEYQSYIIDRGTKGKAEVLRVINLPSYKALPDDAKGNERRLKMIDDRLTSVNQLALGRAKREVAKRLRTESR